MSDPTCLDVDAYPSRGCVVTCVQQESKVVLFAYKDREQRLIYCETVTVACIVDAREAVSIRRALRRNNQVKDVAIHGVFVVRAPLQVAEIKDLLLAELGYPEV